MQILYPEIKPYQRHLLKVSELHELYLDESGNPDGIPVLFVHGGPGAGCDSNSRRFFDPEKYRIICFDQRGCGRSTPHAELQENNTQALVEDIEKIRKYLKVERYVLFGGSWGSTLSLVYAQTYPDRVMGLVLRGIFLCREQDINWFYQEGASRFFPDFWQDFIKPIPVDERTNMIAAYQKKFGSANELERMGAAKAWSVWEARCSALRPQQEIVRRFSKPNVALALALIESHFFSQNTFLDPNQIINNADKLSGIPGIMVHGRYDMVCPLDNAIDLQNRWPDSELHIIRDAGHAASEAGIVDALIRATDEFGKRFDAAS